MCAFTFILSEVIYGTIYFANPKKRVWPLPMSISLSISWNIRVLGWWIVAMMTLPSEASDLRMRMILSELLLSKPEVGSSSTKQLGSASNYTPMATRFRCPPEMLLENWPPTNVFLHYSRLSFLMTWVILYCCSTSDCSCSLSLAWNSKVSSTVRVPNKMSSWRTYAAHLANLMASYLLPFISTWPSRVKPLVR